MAASDRGQQWQDMILDSITEGVFTVDQGWRITSFNKAAEEITGVPRDEALGRRCWEVFRASICERGCALRETFETGEPVKNRTAYILTQEGEQHPIELSTALLRDESGEVAGGVETFRSLKEVETLRRELAGRYTFEDIVSKSPRMQELFGILPRVAESDASVLIQGESGTGKELFARAIHNLSRRKDGPWVPVNCAALPDNLLESELFGHVAGAFTDAKRARKGRFELAHRGTIFLDEIGDVSPALQVRLLRVLQEKRFERLGSSQPIDVDVRVVAATNKPLHELVERGEFREDLYYRLNVVRLDIPPLRERREDIPLLVEHFLERFNRLEGRRITRMDPAAMALLMSHPFPGNVRELMNVVEHAFVLCPGSVIMPEHLPAYLRDQAPRPPAPDAPPAAGPTTLQEAEAWVIRRALERNGYNRAATARELGMHKTTLWRKMKRYGITGRVEVSRDS